MEHKTIKVDPEVDTLQGIVGKISLIRSLVLTIIDISDNKIYNEKGELVADVNIGQTYSSTTGKTYRQMDGVYTDDNYDKNILEKF